MTFSRLDENQAPVDVQVDDERIRMRFGGGLELSVPTSDYPGLKKASKSQRANWTLVSQGYGIHWPDIDEDLSVRGLFQTDRSLPEPPAEQIPALVSDLIKTTDRLNALFPGRPFTPDGHLVGSIGEVVAEYLYDLKLEPCSTPQIDARTKSGSSVQVKLTGATGQSYAFRWPVAVGEEAPEQLLCLKLTQDGFEEIYNGEFPLDLVGDKITQRNGQVRLSISALKAKTAERPIPAVRSFDDIHRWFTPELAEVA